MATAELQENTAVTVPIKRGNELVGIVKVAFEAATLLSRAERIEVKGLLPNKNFVKLMGGGDEDEELTDQLGEIKSLLYTVEGWLKQVAIDEELVVAISAT